MTSPSLTAKVPSREMRQAKAKAARVGWTPYLFAAPVVLYLLVFQGYPLLQELYLSFTSTSLRRRGGSLAMTCRSA